MSNGLYVALSAQVTTEKRLATIANNLANMNTPGFRAEEVKFESIMAEKGAKDIQFAGVGESYTSRKTGPVTFTNSPYDVAIEGNSWLAIQTPDGTAYTRDGRLKVQADGRLTTVNNFNILDQGGTAILVDPDQGTLAIGADGSINQNGNRVGTIGMYEIPASAKLTRHANASVIPDRPATAVQDFNSNVMRQGYVEGSNIDPVMEMTRLITVQRAFESAASAIQEQETAHTDAIRALGPQ
ncbi:flagellar basal-body rod protein FlgF [Azorhizobium oxalatiphilum]|uniref:Flagellar basal-body rod protein FlgF n=1 Tax=Azorhizobium oxalatiphilum TaxID=980631 RepID=A0A917BLA3_9HYPH|nr:flagellar basal-body rod protein FlgF [Azorhizobium oxalatiphilum]GGF47875.1 flagellar basal-body rod protein FlgF [Azorhizobium oxalatiphilum]